MTMTTTMKPTLDEYIAETDRLIAIAETTEHPRCQYTGEEMILQVFEAEEAEDNIECGLPGAQYACFCNGGHYQEIDGSETA